MTSNYEKFLEKYYQKLMDKYDIKSEKYKQLKYEYQLLQSKYRTKEKQLEIALSEAEKNASLKYQNIIDEKDKEIARLKALLNMDGTNTGIPTSKTPINKKKIIPNARVKSELAKEEQTGHKKHKLEKFSDEEINDNVSYELKEGPSCGVNLTQTGEICKDETSYRFVPIKRRNHFIQYKCDCCGKEVNQNIPIRLKEENQYSSEVQPMALTLGNEGNVSINKIRRIIRGFLMALLI